MSAPLLLWKLTGGRPMTRTGHALFDGVARQNVSFYTDKLGREWMAFGAWSLFRVEIRDGKPPTP